MKHKNRFLQIRSFFNSSDSADTGNNRAEQGLLEIPDSSLETRPNMGKFGIVCQLNKPKVVSINQIICIKILKTTEIQRLRMQRK